MLLFGGIFEITKELNDLYLYDFKQNRWITVFEESCSPKKLSPDNSIMDDSSPAGRSPKKTTTSPLSKGFTTKPSPPKSSM